MRKDAPFVVDRDARPKGMSAAERLAHRCELSQEWIDEIKETCAKLSREALPQSALGKTVAYTRNQWPRLVRCLEYEEVDINRPIFKLGSSVGERSRSRG